MLRTSKEISINNLKSTLNRFEEICYCADYKHIKNHSKMMKVGLNFKNCEEKYFKIPTKISYLNLCLYLKLKIERGL